MKAILTILTLTLLTISAQAQNIAVEITDKYNKKVDYSEYVVFKVKFKNKSAKDIRAFKGRLVISDIFGDHLLDVTTKQDDGLAAAGVYETLIGFDTNQFIDTHNTIKATEFENFILSFEVDLILYTDGTTWKRE